MYKNNTSFPKDEFLNLERNMKRNESIITLLNVLYLPLSLMNSLEING